MPIVNSPYEKGNSVFQGPAAKKAAAVAKVFGRLAIRMDGERPYNLKMVREIDRRLPPKKG